MSNDNVFNELLAKVYSSIDEQKEYAFSADIYSLSITIWEILYERYRISIVSIIFRIPFDYITNKFELLFLIPKRKRPKLCNSLPKEVSNFLKRL